MSLKCRVFTFVTSAKPNCGNQLYIDIERGHFRAEENYAACNGSFGMK